MYSPKALIKVIDYNYKHKMALYGPKDDSESLDSSSSVTNKDIKPGESKEKHYAQGYYGESPYGGVSQIKNLIHVYGVTPYGSSPVHQQIVGADLEYGVFQFAASIKSKDGNESDLSNIVTCFVNSSPKDIRSKSCAISSNKITITLRE